MTVEAIIDAAIASRLEIISITDHNSIDALPNALEYAARYEGKLLFIPGIEISAVEGHVLVYFDPDHLERLRELCYKLPIVDDDQGSRVQLSMIEVIRRATELGGLCVAAHIDTKIGFENGNSGFPAWKKDLLIEPGLRGLEFRHTENSRWYSLDDEDPSPEADERRKYAKARLDSFLQGSGSLARFHNSDAHELSGLFGIESTTRIKVTALTFDAFRAALADPEARIKIEEPLPHSISKIIGLGIDGGFLDKTVIRFADNLNVFFGGRGTGKSTAVRALAFALDRDSVSEGNLFQNVSVFCEDANGVQYRFDRSAGGQVVGRIRKDDSITSVSTSEFPIEYYGQGELGRVAERSLKDASALQAFLDRHIEFRGLVERESELLATTREIAMHLAPLREVQRNRATLQVQLNEIEARLRASEETKIKEIAHEQNKLTAEQTLRASLVELSTQYKRGISLKGLIRSSTDLRHLSRVEEYDAATAAAFRSIEREIDGVNRFLDDKAGEVNETLRSAADTIDVLLDGISGQHVAIQGSVQKHIGQLQERGLASSIAELNALSLRKGQLVAQIARIDVQRAAHDDEMLRFGEALTQLNAIRVEIDQRRDEQRTRLNVGFKRETYGRLQVMLIPDGQSSAIEYAQYVERHLEGTYYQTESVDRLVASISPTDLANLLDSQKIESLVPIDGIGPKWAPIFMQRLGGFAQTLELRTFRRMKSPRFKVIERSTKKEIPFSYLSDGQKHTIMLTVALLAGAQYPLVIDQPEDDLDNKFIAERLVKSLRDVKEIRQVILVTHNANIAVLGDSEQLLAMEHNQEGGGRVASRGSIDNLETKRAVQDCLEGGREALRRRFEVYGL